MFRCFQQNWKIWTIWQNILHRLSKKSSKIILSISQNVETSPKLPKNRKKDLILPFATFWMKRSEKKDRIKLNCCLLAWWLLVRDYFQSFANRYVQSNPHYPSYFHFNLLLLLLLFFLIYLEQFKWKCYPYTFNYYYCLFCCTVVQATTPEGNSWQWMWIYGRYWMRWDEMRFNPFFELKTTMYAYHGVYVDFSTFCIHFQAPFASILFLLFYFNPVQFLPYSFLLFLSHLLVHHSSTPLWWCDGGSFSSYVAF